jgi:hypothetical protein
VKTQALCPNCGEQIDGVREKVESACAHCGEALTVSFENKIVLAHPVQTFVDPASRARGKPRQTDSVRGNQISDARKRRSNELALERNQQEQDHALKGLVSGIMGVVFGGLLMALAFLRLAYLSDDWLNYVGFSLGLVFVLLGAYIAIWFSLLARAKGKEESEIMRERLALDED